MEALFVIPARKGSKGLPGKNTRLLAGKPLIQYSIETALSITSPENICVTTDSDEAISVAKNCGLNIPFIRPEELSSDKASSRDVIMHAVNHYEREGKKYDAVVLLQPTSPFRKKDDILHMMEMYDNSSDLIVSVKESHDNPYFSIYEEDAQGFLHISKPGQFTRRQDSPKAYAFNGSVYVIQLNTYMQKSFNGFQCIRKYVMPEIYSVDIDTPFDWNIAEMILDKKLLS